ncbi:UNVERIFIED_CONTAM: hypothetical protein Sradi_1346400 [Sesamum radiatum]|uniref:DUF4283 domain-containing protein n=1 Tax=Sesamum radiatum TaxID=300843 RepID=A0AAW2UQL3_SESRA
MATRFTKTNLGHFRSSICLCDDEEAGMLMPDGLWNSDTESFHLCLVRRLLTSHSYKFNGFCASIKDMLIVVKGVDIKQLREGRLLLKFNHIIDRDSALKGCPWSFDKHVLILNGIWIDENPMQVDLNHCDFYVHIHDLSLS